MRYSVFPISPDDYQRHPIHVEERNWGETNCYVDVWIELLHAWGFDPVAALPFTIGIDFEGDQWTFFKFPHADLATLYGLEVQELVAWRTLAGGIETQVRLGRPVLVELDSFFLPDTAGTAYHREHVKSTVAVVEIDLEERLLGYFHNQVYHRLHGDDFTDALHVTDQPQADFLPPYIEYVKPRTRPELSTGELATVSLELLRQHVARLPEVNPFERFQRTFAADLEWLASSPLEVFHQYSFVTLRQFGACYELAATYFDWLAEQGIIGFEAPRAAFAELARGAKTLQFQLARAMSRKKPLDLSSLETLKSTWNLATSELRARCDRQPAAADQGFVFAGVL